MSSKSKKSDKKAEPAENSGKPTGLDKVAERLIKKALRKRIRKSKDEKEAIRKLTTVPLDRDVKMKDLPLIPVPKRKLDPDNIEDAHLMQACTWVPGSGDMLKTDFVGHGDGELNCAPEVTREELERMTETTNRLNNADAAKAEIPGQVDLNVPVQNNKPLLYANDIPDYVLAMFTNPLPECELESTVNVGESVTVTYVNRSSGDSVSVVVYMGAGKTESGKAMSVSSVIRRPRALYCVNATFTPYDLSNTPRSANAAQLYSYILANLNIVGG